MKPWTLSLTIVDAKNEKAVHKVHLPFHINWDITTVQQWAAQYVSALEPLIGGTRGRLLFTLDVYLPPALDRAPTPESDVEERLWVQMLLADDPAKPYSFDVATWRDEFLVLAGDEKRVPDHTQPEVVAWLNLIRAAPTLGYEANPCDGRGKEWSELGRSFQVFKYGG